VKYRAGYRYQLAENEYYQSDIMPLGVLADTEWVALDNEGLLTIRAGYAWDGASGPAMHAHENMRASLIHDAYYQLIRLGLVHAAYRAAADRIYRRVCIEDGMTEIRAEAHFLALRMFGATAATFENEPVVITAP
jgi:hypothetical protein